jgi:hypothetical protein
MKNVILPKKIKHEALGGGVQTIDFKTFLQDKENEQKCAWRFERLSRLSKKNSKPTYRIWNLSTNQTLFVHSNPFGFARNLMLGSSKSTSDQFKWILDCSLPGLSFRYKI